MCCVSLSLCVVLVLVLPSVVYVLFCIKSLCCIGISPSVVYVSCIMKSLCCTNVSPSFCSVCIVLH